MKAAAPNALRHKILQEAIGILYREGVDHITMRGLAEQLGHSAATIYLYFKNKDDLVHQIAMHGFGRLEAATRPALEVGDPAEALKEAGRRYVDFGLSNGELYRLMFQEFTVAGYEAPEARRAAEIWALYRELYRRGIASGAFRPAQPDIEITACWAMFHGFVLLCLAERMPPRAAGGTSLRVLREAILDDRIRALRP